MFFWLVLCTFIGACFGGFVGALGGLLFGVAVPYALAFIDAIYSQS